MRRLEHWEQAERGRLAVEEQLGWCGVAEGWQLLAARARQEAQVAGLQHAIADLREDLARPRASLVLGLRGLCRRYYPPVFRHGWNGSSICDYTFLVWIQTEKTLVTQALKQERHLHARHVFASPALPPPSRV